MIDLDLGKVLGAATGGIGNWALPLDSVLHIAISLATLFYILLKIREQLNKGKP
jgi:hypothetical protein